MKLSPQHLAALKAIQDARAIERNARAVAELEVAQIIAERTKGAYDNTQRAIAYALTLDPPVSTRQIGIMGLGTTDPHTPRRRIAELATRPETLYANGVKVEVEATWAEDMLTVRFDGFKHPKREKILFDTFVFPFTRGTDAIFAGDLAVHTPEVESGEWGEDLTTLMSLFGHPTVLTAVSVAIPDADPVDYGAMLRGEQQF